MNEIVFYVYPQNGKDKRDNATFDKTKWVAAKFLIVNGEPVVDPNPQGATHIHIYRNLNANGRIDESSIFTNSKNYVIVPLEPDDIIGNRFAIPYDV